MKSLMHELKYFPSLSNRFCIQNYCCTNEECRLSVRNDNNHCNASSVTLRQENLVSLNAQLEKRVQDSITNFYVKNLPPVKLHTVYETASSQFRAYP